VRKWFEPLLLDDCGRYPRRTTAQLSDFLDTIKRDMTESKHLRTAKEKMKLYFNHEDAIREVKEAVDTVYQYERELATSVHRGIST
jgi:hypothetical protein